MKENIQFGLKTHTRTESRAWNGRIAVLINPTKESSHELNSASEEKNNILQFDQKRMATADLENNGNRDDLTTLFHDLISSTALQCGVYKSPQELDALAHRITDFTETWATNHKKNPATVEFTRRRLKKIFEKKRLIPEE